MFAIGGLSNSVEATERTFYVNSTDDEGDPWPGDGDCDTLSPAGECTLRAALEEIYGLYMGFDLPVDKDTHTITVPAGTYNLTLGELGVGGNIIINGAGRNATIIDGQASDRVMSIGAPVSPDVVTIQINDLEVRNGQGGSGGGLYIFDGNVTLNNVNIANNYADAMDGGGIINWGQLTLNHVVFSGNQAEQHGGAIYNHAGGVLQVMDSTFYRNKSLDVTGLRAGGAIYNGDGASLVVQRSTFEGNNAPSGGGLYNNGSAQLTNVTFVNNKGTTTFGPGGAAIYNNAWAPAQLWLWNVTISGNESTVPAALTNSGNIEVMAHTIVADNIGGDCNNTGTVESANEHHNLAGDSSCSTVMTDPTDQTSTDPKLLTLADNGGPTETMGLASDSPAIDAGGICNSGGAPLLTDQRGWPRTVDGDVDGTATCDLGAFEAPPPYQLWLPLIMR
jgi:CSLREA domain-containing protein